MKTIHATLEYENDGRKVSTAIQLEVAENTCWGRWRRDLAERAREILEPTKADNGMVYFRLDGTKKPLTLWEHIVDRWHQLTWRGRPVTGSTFVPIWR